MLRDRTTPSGEAAQVAARVRALLGTGTDPEWPQPERSQLERSQPERSGPEASRHPDYGPIDLGEPLLPAGDDRAPTGRGGASLLDRLAPSLAERIAAHVPVRLDPGRRGALAVGVAVLVAALATGVWLMSARPRAVPVSANVPSVAGAAPLVGTDGATEPAAGGSGASGSSPGAVAAATSPVATRVVVDVAGKVRHPGVYRLPLGSRVDDALRAAGGPRGHVDLSSLNLAALLVDGQQVAVGVPAAGPLGGTAGSVAPGGSTGADTGAGASTGTIVALNSATLEQLESLPGVGPVLGQDILDYRTEHGSFTSVDQLKDVSGIGDVKFAEISPLVTL